MSITWLIKGVNAPGGFPTRVANALKVKSTRVDLESSIFNEDRPKYVWIGSIPWKADLDTPIGYIQIRGFLSTPPPLEAYK